MSRGELWALLVAMFLMGFATCGLVLSVILR